MSKKAATEQIQDGLPSELTLRKVLAQVFVLIHQAKIRPDMKLGDWAKVLNYLHHKGWLYVTTEGDKVTTAFAAYKVREVDEHTNSKVPDEEEGDIIFIPFYVPKGKKFGGKALKDFLSMHEGAKEIAFFNENEVLTRHVLRRTKWAAKKV